LHPIQINRSFGESSWDDMIRHKCDQHTVLNEFFHFYRFMAFHYDFF